MASSRQAWVEGALGRYEAPLLRYASRLLDDPEAARDVVQDCFVRLCEQKPEQLDGHLAEWLFTVCRRRAIDHLRRDGRMHRLDDAEPAVKPEDPVERREDEATLLQRVSQLPKQ